mmetsp:Transcript_20644/g.57596  ORF Transcript_20644/g.57596 Transcript_20644/m.57596 type:complete len:266 (-) Transcript_20644:267-1064(-)
MFKYSDSRCCTQLCSMELSRMLVANTVGFCNKLAVAADWLCPPGPVPVAPATLLPPPKKIARYCMIASKRYSRWMSVRCLTCSYASWVSSSSSMSELIHSSRHCKNWSRRSASENTAMRRRYPMIRRHSGSWMLDFKRDISCCSIVCPTSATWVMSRFTRGTSGCRRPMRPTKACRSRASSYTPLRTQVSMSCGTSSSSSRVACSLASSLFWVCCSNTDEDWTEKDSHVETSLGMSCKRWSKCPHTEFSSVSMVCRQEAVFMKAS